MDFLPDSEIVNLKYQLAQQIKANINRAASSKNSNTPFLESCIDTLVDEIAELKIEISKLSLTVSNRQQDNNNHSLSNHKKKQDDLVDDLNTKSEQKKLSLPIRSTPYDLQNIDNFYYPETGKDNNTYIWIGPENKTSLEFPITIKSPIEIILKNVRFITDATRKSLKIFINGEELELEQSKQKDLYTITAVWLPLNNKIQDKCQIDILVDKSLSLQDIYPGNNDTRHLCLALEEIEITNHSPK